MENTYHFQVNLGGMLDVLSNRQSGERNKKNIF